MNQPGKKLKIFHPKKYLKMLKKGFYLSISLFLFLTISMILLLLFKDIFLMFYILYIVGLVGVIISGIELKIECPVLYQNGVSPIEWKLKCIILKKRTFIHFNDIWKFPYHKNWYGGFTMRVYLRDGKSHTVEVDEKEDIDLILNANEKYKFV